MPKLKGIFDVLEDLGLAGSQDLSRVPNVPQRPLERYVPPRGRPANLSPLLTPETGSRMLEYARRGEQAGGREWYNTEPLRRAFEEELGTGPGQERYNRFMDIVAATSPRSKVDQNIRRGSYLLAEDVAGRPIADLKNPDFPAGYGHLAHETQNYMLRDLAGGGSFSALNRPKVSSFAENLKGNQAPMTIDTHNFAAITGNMKNKKSPSNTQYKYLEDFQVELADKMNMTPAQFQASVWMGADTGVADARPFMEVFDDVIARTAERDSKSKTEVLRDFIRGDAPLYSFAGGAMLGAGQLIAPEDTTGMTDLLPSEMSAARHNQMVDERMRAMGVDPREQPGYEYGSILPMRRSTITGEREMAIPSMVRPMIRGVMDMSTAPRSGVFNPQGLFDVML